MTSRIRVLVVDDEVALTENIASLLRSRKFDAEVAYNGVQALDAVSGRASFDVVLLDYKMPDLDGIQVLRKLKDMSPELQVIMLTGEATVEIGIEAIRAGAFDYLIKPCNIEDLTEKLRSATDLKHIRSHPVLWPRTMIGEVIMYAFTKLTKDDPLVKALEVFNSDRRKMAGETLFIVDDENVLMGILSQKDLVDAALVLHPEKNITWDELRRHPEWLPDASIGEVMGSRVFAAHPEMTLIAAARTMVENGIHSMPVVDGGGLIGIVRLKDILKYMEPELAEGA
ncbi:MAG: response regulator [Syntrophobacteraceae bacterium]